MPAVLRVFSDSAFAQGVHMIPEEDKRYGCTARGDE